MALALYLICAADILLAIVLWRKFRRAVDCLRRDAASQGAPECSVDVIMPARNEALDVAAAVKSVLGQQHEALRLLAINDHSNDGTGDILDRIASEDERLVVIHDPPLRAGWLGKCNAMQDAWEHVSEASVVILTDADIRHEPRCLSEALGEMDRDQLDLLSYFPFVESKSFWEQQLLPMFVGGLSWYCVPGVNRDDSPQALAAGAFIAVRARVLRELGGFESLKDKMMDDIELARAAKRAGFRTRFRLAPELLSVRLFKSNRDAFWGTTKNILGLVEGHSWIAVGMILFVIVNLWSPIAATLLGIVWSDPLLSALGIATYAAQFGNLWMSRRLFELHFVRAMFFPSSSLAFTCCTVRASIIN